MADIQYYDIEVSHTIPISKYKSLSDSGNASSINVFETPVVIDNAIWVVTDFPVVDGRVSEQSTVWSCDGNHVAMQIRSKKFTVCEVDSRSLVTFDYHPLHNIKPNIERMTTIMAENQNNAQTELEALLGQMNETGGGAPQQMESFNAGQTEGDKGSKKPAKPVVTLPSELKDKFEQTDDIIAVELQGFNYRHGSLIAHITATDVRNEINTKMVLILDENKKPTIDPAAPQEQKEAFARGAEVSSRYLRKEAHLTARQVKPGKTLATVVAAPIGGLVPLSRFKAGEEVLPDDTKTDLEYRIIRTDLRDAFYDFYFGSRIKENPATHGGASNEVTLTGKVVNVTKNGVTSKKVRRQFVTKGRPNVLMGTNHFPIKVYKTISLSGATAEDFAKLNVSVFGPMVNAAAPKNETQTKFERLRAKDAGLVKVTDGQITSSFFTQDVNARETITILPFHNKKAAPLTSLDFPERTPKFNETTKKTTYPYTQYSTVDKNALENPAVAPLLSLNSPRFKHIVEAAKGLLTVENLRELVRQNTTKKESSALSNQELLKLQLSIARKEEGYSLVSMDNAFTDYGALAANIESLRNQA